LREHRNGSTAGGCAQELAPAGSKRHRKLILRCT
jgi:hypothetical protein